jgi:hypothetical protein
MSSELQQLASRTNGAKSRGPLTEEGKQASSGNSLAHGFNSKRVVLPGESPEEFDEFLAAFLDEHLPETPTERALIENLAAARWRQRRVWAIETAGIANELRRPRYIEGEDFDTRAFVAFRTLADDSPVLNLLNRYDARFERQFRNALTAFLNLRAKRRAAERADATPSPGGTTEVKVFWVDDESGKTLPADTHPDPQPEPEKEPASGSFGKAKNHGLQLVPSPVGEDIEVEPLLPVNQDGSVHGLE